MRVMLSEVEASLTLNLHRKGIRRTVRIPRKTIENRMTAVLLNVKNGDFEKTRAALTVRLPDAAELGCHRENNR